MKMLNSILEGTSMSKWEMNTLVGGDNNNEAQGCGCTGGLKTDNNNHERNCSCSSPYASLVPSSNIKETGFATVSNSLAISSAYSLIS